jgi:hypothetical protein
MGSYKQKEADTSESVHREAVEFQERLLKK